MVPKKSIEFEGKTVEDAINNALLVFKTKRKSLKIIVLSEEEKGLFGMQGARPAKIRVSLQKKQ